MVNVGVTKVYKNNQTTIPSKVRKELNISENSIISWDLNPDKTITISVKSEKPSVKDLVGYKNICIYSYDILNIKIK